MVAGIPVRLGENPTIVHRDLCRDFTTDLGVVKLAPVEEIAANLILAAVHPEPDPDAHQRAHLLLVNALTDAFQMNWTTLHALCHRPDYRVGEELAQMRLAAKRDADAAGLSRDHVGEVAPPTAAADATPGQPTDADAPERLAAADSAPIPGDRLESSSPKPAPALAAEAVIDLSKIEPSQLSGELSA